MSIKQGEIQHDSQWLTSFGDLITLMVCFFIAILASGSYVLDMGRSEGQEELGTSVATPRKDSLPVGVYQGVVLLSKKSIRRGDWAALDEISILNNESNSEVLEVEATRCLLRKRNYLSQGAHHLEELRRQLIDRGFSPANLRLSTMGRGCGEGAGRQGQNPAAKVRFKVRISNG